MDPTFPHVLNRRSPKELVTLCAMPRLHERQLRRALQQLQRKEARSGGRRTGRRNGRTVEVGLVVNDGWMMVVDVMVKLW